VVRKRHAAKLLAITVPALDRWIDLGRIPAKPLPSAPSRSGVPIDVLVDLAVACRHVAGARRLAAALDQLDERAWRTKAVTDAHHLIEAVTLLGAGTTRGAT
jgi:hypothetical protein